MLHRCVLIVIAIVSQAGDYTRIPVLTSCFYLNFADSKILSLPAFNCVILLSKPGFDLIGQTKCKQLNPAER